MAAYTQAELASMPFKKLVKIADHIGFDVDRYKNGAEETPARREKLIKAILSDQDNDEEPPQEDAENVEEAVHDDKHDVEQVDERDDEEADKPDDEEVEQQEDGDEPEEEHREKPSSRKRTAEAVKPQGTKKPRIIGRIAKEDITEELIHTCRKLTLEKIARAFRPELTTQEMRYTKRNELYQMCLELYRKHKGIAPDADPKPAPKKRTKRVQEQPKVADVVMEDVEQDVQHEEVREAAEEEVPPVTSETEPQLVPPLGASADEALAQLEEEGMTTPAVLHETPATQDAAESEDDDEAIVETVEDVVKDEDGPAEEVEEMTVNESDIVDVLNMIEETDTEDALHNLSDMQRSIMKCLGLQA